MLAIPDVELICLIGLVLAVPCQQLQACKTLLLISTNEQLMKVVSGEVVSGLHIVEINIQLLLETKLQSSVFVTNCKKSCYGLCPIVNVLKYRSIRTNKWSII